jgi:thiamine biosynthesis lipoprotein
MQLSLPLWRPGRAASAPARRALERPAAAGTWLSREEAIMGTAVRVELWAEQRRVGEAAIDAVMAEMHRIDRCYSPHRPDSELSRLNRGAGKAPFAASPELFALLQRAQAFSALSGGAFDITYAAVGRLFDYRHGIRPDDAALARARECVGWQQVQLDAAERRVHFSREGVCVDLGGFAKGHAVERGAAILRSHGIAHAIVMAGGDSRVVGDRRGRPWSVAVRHPRRPGEVVAVLPLEDVAVSTSGDYERFFERGGVRYHHLLDPATGRSPDHVHSVTILAPDGLTSEALSKSVFVLGVEQGLALVAQVPGTDAVVIDAAGTLHYSEGLQRR